MPGQGRHFCDPEGCGTIGHQPVDYRDTEHVFMVQKNRKSVSWQSVGNSRIMMTIYKYAVVLMLPGRHRDFWAKWN